MLAYILALAVGFGSFAIYMAAFFFPEVHRKSDFPWSGVGLFYALILWVCAGRITGAVLLGQIASVALLGWFAWQTLTLRRELTPVAGQTPIPKVDMAGKLTDFKGLGSIGSVFGKKPDKTPKTATTAGQKSSQPESESVSSEAVAETSEYEDGKGAIAFSPSAEMKPPTVSNADAVSVTTVGKGDLTDDSFDAVGEEVAHPKETASVESFTVSKTAIPPTIQTQSNDDDFDGVEDFAESTQEGQFAGSPEVVKTSKRSSPDFGGLLANLRNNLASFGGFGKAKTKPVEAKKETKTSILESGIPIHPTADIDEILESKLEDFTPEVVPETFVSLTKNVESMSAESPESMTADSKDETVGLPGEITEVMTTENLTAAVDKLETEVPIPPVEMVEMVSEPITEPVSVVETSEPEKDKSPEVLETLEGVSTTKINGAEAEGEAKLVGPIESEPV